MINAKAGRLDEFPSNMRTVPRKSPYLRERPESDAESVWEKKLKMSSSTSDFKSVSETLQVSNMQDDSLCTDEFEIIDCGTLSKGSPRSDNGSCERNDDTMSQWSTKHSINVESTIPMNDLSHLLCSTHSEIPSVVSRTLRQSSKGCTTSPGNSTAEPDALKETPILAGTVKSPSSSMNTMADMQQENADLKRMNANGGQVSAPVRKLNECEVAEHKEIEQKLKDLQQQAASGEKDLADVTDQLETALRKIADLTESHNSATVKCGEGFNLPLINEQMVVREMQEKEAYAEKLKLELEETRKLLNEQMECCDKKENELRTHVEIINVLKEEDTEGRREIAEKDRKIAELEEMVRFMRLNRAEVNNC
ncbi:unnamed protein product [Nippostrongylus brasiliensis]|uniref:Coiled-coil domain-containing protein 186 n=1 Tax=Nippostrongylus brasiliensis TaxID=27835 RepID=A0A0N4YQV5_NIPBR|nr:unnamed protein product [Nippostrongylus brasiliensis]